MGAAALLLFAALSWLALHAPDPSGKGTPRASVEQAISATGRVSMASAAAPRRSRDDGPRSVGAHVDRAPRADLDIAPRNLAGWVRDATGGSITGARVAVGTLGFEGAAPEALTDANGWFGMSVPDGAVRFSVEAEGYAPREVALASPAAHLEVLLTPASRISGRITDGASREPVAGVEVAVISSDTEGRRAGTATSDPTGHFSVEPVSAGSYDVVAEVGDRYGAVRAVSVGIAEAAGPIDIELRPSAVFEANVRVDERPCPGATITLSGEQRHEGQAAHDGRIWLSGVVPGAYAVSIACPRALPHEERLQLARGRNEHQWNLDAGHRVVGRVDTPGGGGVVGALISVVPRADDSPGRGRQAPSDRGVHCLTDEHGEFECTGMEDGVYELLLSVQGERQAESVVVPVPGRAVIDPIVLRADPAGAIVVQLDGASIERGLSVPLFALREGRRFAVRAERHGSSHAFERLPLGSYDVFLGPSLQASAARERVVLKEDAEFVRITLSVPTLGSIQGRLLDDAGGPLPDVWISPRSTQGVWRLSSDSSASGLTDSEGFFELPHLLPGHYRLHARGDAGSRLFEPVVEVTPGRAAEITLTSALHLREGRQ